MKPFLDKFEAANHLTLALEKHISDITIGYAKTDIIGESHIVFGEFNNREINEEHVNDLAFSFIKDGLLHYSPIILLLEKEWIQNQNLPKSYTPTSTQTLPILMLTKEGSAAFKSKKILALTGRHRVHARARVIQVVDNFFGPLQKPKKANNKDVDPKLKNQLETARLEVNKFPVWILDYGEFHVDFYLILLFHSIYIFILSYFYFCSVWPVTDC